MRAAAVTLSLAIAMPLANAQWLELGGPGAPAFPRVELDVASLDFPEPGPQAVVRVTRARPQPHRRGLPFRSFVAVVRFECGLRSLVPIAVSFHALPRGSGDVVATESDLTPQGVTPSLLASVRPAIRARLLRVACAERAAG